MWISLPVPEEEIGWLEELAPGWRRTSEGLFRQSGVELALVSDPEIWDRWQLPRASAPIVSVTVSTRDGVDAIVAKGARWERAISRTAWGKQAGFLRFPSGLLVECIVETDTP